MGTFIGLIVIVVIYAIFKSAENTKFQNKNPLDVDNSKNDKRCMQWRI